MDKAEYQEKLKEIRELADEGKNEQAADIITQINWKRVKSASTLCQVGSILGKVGRYEEGKELLLMAYDRSPIGRTIVYQLAELTFEHGDYEEAEDYYNEFIEIAPRDSKRYELLYKLQKVKGASLDDLIKILEELKDRDFSEEWSYELAQMYHKAGKGDKCVALCDDIILWFGEGSYVEKAMELKMLYRPLTDSQTRQYEELKMKKEGFTRVGPEDILESGEILHNDVTIPTIETNVNRFNTINLQAEIAKGMQQIMEATEKDTVTSTMENIRKIVGESQIPMLEEPVEKEERYENIETDEEIDGSLSLNFKEILAEDTDGQMSLVVPENPMIEKQITGQMSIEEVLVEWEKTKHAAETAMEDAKRRKLESARARAIAETEDIMDKLADVIPVVEEVKSEPAVDEIVQEDPEIEIKETFLAAEEVTAPQEELDSGLSDTITKESETEMQSILEEIGKGIAEDDSELEGEDGEGFPTEEDLVSQAAEALQEEDGMDDGPIEFLTKEQKDIFSYFIPVSGMEKQICAVLQGVKSRQNDHTSWSGNIIVEGGERCGKTVLATDLIKVLQQITSRNTAKVGRISADSLNKKDVTSVMEKIKGGYLIIEKAGNMTVETAQSVSDHMEGNTEELLVILEDTKKGISSLLTKAPTLMHKFTEKIKIPIFTNDELVSFGKIYAKELEYGIDEMAVLALYKRIGNITKVDDATTLTEVKEIVDDAIAHAEKKHLSKTFNIIFSRRYDDDNHVILREKDFEA